MTWFFTLFVNTILLLVSCSAFAKSVDLNTRDISEIEAGDIVRFKNGDEYQIERVLGAGDFGRVFLISYKGKLRALKVLVNDLNNERHVLQSQADQLAGFRQLQVSTPEIISVPTDPNHEHYLVLEYGDGGTFFERWNMKKTAEDKLKELRKLALVLYEISRSKYRPGDLARLGRNLVYSSQGEGKYLLTDPGGKLAEPLPEVLNHLLPRQPLPQALCELMLFEHLIREGKIKIDSQIPQASAVDEKGNINPRWVVEYTGWKAFDSYSSNLRAGYEFAASMLSSEADDQDVRAALFVLPTSSQAESQYAERALALHQQVNWETLGGSEKVGLKERLRSFKDKDNMSMVLLTHPYTDPRSMLEKLEPAQTFILMMRLPHLIEYPGFQNSRIDLAGNFAFSWPPSLRFQWPACSGVAAHPKTPGEPI